MVTCLLMRPSDAPTLKLATQRQCFARVAAHVTRVAVCVARACMDIIITSPDVANDLVPIGVPPCSTMLKQRRPTLSTC